MVVEAEPPRSICWSAELSMSTTVKIAASVKVKSVKSSSSSLVSPVKNTAGLPLLTTKEPELTILGWFPAVACTALLMLPDWSYQVSTKPAPLNAVT